MDFSEICFLFSYIDTDVSLSIRLIEQLQHHYPTSKIIVINDGGRDRSVAATLRPYDTHIEGTNLYPLEFGGAWIERSIEMFLAFGGADHLILVCSDSFVIRQFSYLPSADSGGSLLNVGNTNFVQGGCIYLSRDACKEIIHSRLLKSAKYKSRNFGYKRFACPYLMPGEHGNEKVYGTHDRMLSEVLYSLHLTVVDWPEVHCRVREPCLQPDRYAIIHPVKG